MLLRVEIGARFIKDDMNKKNNAIIHYTGLTMVGAVKVAQKGDTTQKRRQDKRKTELQDAAIRDGFETWSAALTAWKNGEAKLVRVSTIETLSRGGGNRKG